MASVGTLALPESAREPAGLAIAFRERITEGRAEAVVQHLAAARAAAWTHGDQQRLRAAEVTGSPAYQRDSEDLRTAADQKVRYDGLKFTVRSAKVQQGSGEVVHVTAMIDRSAYGVVTAKGRRTVPAAAGQQTDLSVQWTDSGWRVVDWAEASTS